MRAADKAILSSPAAVTSLVLRQPRYPYPVSGTGGFASLPYDRFAQKVREQCDISKRQIKAECLETRHAVA